MDRAAIYTAMRQLFTRVVVNHFARKIAFHSLNWGWFAEGFGKRVPALSRASKQWESNRESATP